LRGEVLFEKKQFNIAPKSWPFGNARSVVEDEVRTAVEAGLGCVIFNPTTVLGPGDHDVVSGILLILVAQKTAVLK
jgi:hypothetical protein